jgi:hypothetical protein
MVYNSIKNIIKIYRRSNNKIVFLMGFYIFFPLFKYVWKIYIALLVFNFIKNIFSTILRNNLTIIKPTFTNKLLTSFYRLSHNISVIIILNFKVSGKNIKNNLKVLLFTIITGSSLVLIEVFFIYLEMILSGIRYDRNKNINVNVIETIRIIFGCVWAAFRDKFKIIDSGIIG